MSEYAKVIDGVVVSVIVADEDFIISHPEKELFIKTAYDPETREGKVGPGFELEIRPQQDQHLAPIFRRKGDDKPSRDAVPSLGDDGTSPQVKP